jgi:AMP deaminase
MSSVDLCELARNSALQSGFPTPMKSSWLGAEDPLENNIMQRANVPNARLALRRRFL